MAIAQASTFGTTVRELASYEHLVPGEFRAAATELAAIVHASGVQLDPRRLDRLVSVVPAPIRPTAYAVVTSLMRLRPKEREEIASWAHVLLVFRSGKPEPWERRR